MHLSAISFHLAYCVGCLLSEGCRVIAFLASSFCPFMGEVGQGTCAQFLMGGTDVCPPVPLLGRSVLRDGIRDSPRRLYAAYLLMGGSVLSLC